MLITSYWSFFFSKVIIRNIYDFLFFCSAVSLCVAHEDSLFNGVVAKSLQGMAKCLAEFLFFLYIHIPLTSILLSSYLDRKINASWASELM